MIYKDLHIDITIFTSINNMHLKDFFDKKLKNKNVLTCNLSNRTQK